MNSSKNTDDNNALYKKYISPRQLAVRWDCSSTTARRIADRAGMSKYFLGEGRNGMVRYSINEVEAYETQRCTAVMNK